MKRVWLFMTWLCATVLVSWFAYQGLEAADGEVRDGPRTAVVVDSLADSTAMALATTTSGGDVSGTDATGAAVIDPTGESLLPVTTRPSSSGSATTATTQSSSSGSDTTPATQGSTTSTTVAPTTAPTTASTTTTVSEAWQTTTIASPGGTLTVSYRPGEVRYEAAVPAAGYDLEVESTGPDVKVEFTSDEDGYEIRARWKDGGFSPEVKDT